MELSERKKRILRAIIESYITTAEPVGSKAIADALDRSVSSATIRNEMADLESMGLLETVSYTHLMWPMMTLYIEVPRPQRVSLMITGVA